MSTHKSTAFIKAIDARGCFKPDPITPQFRFVIRMANTCHERNVPYDMVWKRHGPIMSATVSASGDIPTPKPLPKPKRIAPDWKPSIFEAVYKLEAWRDATRLQPGFVIEHSSGLALVRPSQSDEMDAGEDLKNGWMVSHAASGRGFGLKLNFKRAVDALLLATSFDVDWSTPNVEAFKTNPEFKRAGDTVAAAFGTKQQKDTAKWRLERR